MKKVALITGASSGIGKSTARKLLSEGYVVYGAARSVDKMADLKKAGAHIMKIDVTDETSIVDGVKKIVDEQGRIDVLINNAGYAVYGPVEDVSMEDARRQFDVNIFGLARLTQLVLPHMREQKAGKIVNISSIGGKIYTPLGAWYHATKHALEGWSDCLRLEVSEFGIDVIIIEPGLIETNFGNVLMDQFQLAENSAYQNLTKRVEQGTKQFYEEGAGSPPSVIADVISKALKAKKPKTRYAAGKLAKQIIFLRSTFSDRFFDRTVMSRV